MFRTIRIAFLAALGLVLVFLAIANRSDVTLRLLPAEMDSFFGLSTTIVLPLYVVIYGGIVAGLLIGFLWEWIREARIRDEANRAKRELSALQREVATLKDTQKGSREDVLALLE